MLQTSYNQTMQRILIIGIMASGKSTFAKKLGEHLDIPVHHLDMYYWKPGWVRPNSQQEWLETIHKLISQESWIIEGNYGNTLAIRMQRADTIIIFNHPKWLCLVRSFKRLYTSRNKTFDKKAGVKEKVSIKLIKNILTFKIDKILKTINANKTTQKVIIVKNDQQLEELIN
jgi:adenylate kinase family enzyme